MSEIKRYNTVMVVLHWFLALLILGAIFMGAVVLDEMESNNPQKILLLKLHIIAGIVILLFTLLRLVVRFTTPQPKPLAGSRLLQMASTGVHHLLYLLTIFTVLAGIALAVSANLQEVLLNHAGELPADYHDFIAHEAHEVFANLLFLAILVHVAAALYHQFILKDGLLSRMSLRKEQ